ncbi:MAG: hypothetical protein JW797_17480 [Bradymonadales bacterium]|nr:hypothetical protein [Bradymonadales bacterium]
MVIHKAISPVLALSILALLVVSCPCGYGRSALFHESFEVACGDLPCNWRLLEGTATLVETFHAGEHALELSENARIQTNLSAVWIDQDDHVPLTVGLICSQGSTLAFTLTIDNQGTTYTATGETDGSWSFDERYIESIEVRLTPVQNAPYRSQEAIRLEVQLNGPGECILDDLRILSADIVECLG